MQSKSCTLDPLPTFLLKDPSVCDALLPSILDIINHSLTSGQVPPCLKVAQVKPRPKKPGSDITDPKNLRPISNLPTIKKLLEKCVVADLMKYLNNHNILDPFQSAYRPSHSTETAMLRIQSDIIDMDRGEGALLVLLDLSAAFDTLDHQILLNRLQHLVGISGVALDWLRSYLSDRKQFVQIGDARSSWKDLNIGVPQGSCLGPLLFVLYTLPLGDIIRKHGLQYHQYADDTQVYCNLKSRDCDSTILRVERCLGDIRTWMSVNKLKLNESKTELIIFSSKQTRHLYQNIAITFGGSVIMPTTLVRNLGAWLDSDLSMTRQVNSIIKTAYFHLRRIAKIRSHLDRASCAKVVVAFVSSRLDYHNGLLTGATQRDINRLQLLQNNAARLITRSPRGCHITPVLAELHWLPVSYRIEYKVLTNAHK
jgi:hypothetical protein